MKNYANLRKKMMILLLIFSNSMLFAQFTRQQAIQKVLNEIVVADTGNIDVYSVYELKYYNDSILLAFDTTLLCPYNYNWVFFVNDDPAANWVHPCRYIFIDSISGNYQTINQYQYPACFDNPTCNDYELVSQIESYPPVQLLPNLEYNGGGVTPNENLFAVIIVTQDAESDPHFPANRFWFDASLIYNTLKEAYGFTDENIFVHYEWWAGSDDGGDFENLQTWPPTNNIDYAATKLNISETFNNLSGINTIESIPELNETQQLFVFIEGHGTKMYGNSSLMLINSDHTYDYFYDYELADLVEDINCAQMTFLIQPCNSGKFADELTDYNSRNVACRNRIVHTATSLDLVSKTEFNLTQKKYCEFTYYWAAATRGFYPVTSEPWTPSQYAVSDLTFFDLYPISHPINYPPDQNNDGFVQMEEAFSYANDFDSWSEAGYYIQAQGEDPKEIPQNYNEMGVDNLTTLKGLAGHIDNDQEIMENRAYVVGDVVTVLDNNDFYINDNAIINCIGENAKFVVDAGGIMTTELNVSITGGEVIANGELIIGNVATFTNCDISINGVEDVDIGDQVEFNDLEFNLNNSSLNTDIAKAIFNQCILANYGQSLDIVNTVFNNNVIAMQIMFYNYGLSLNISNTVFNNCYMIYSELGNVSVNNQSSFLNTWLYLENTNVHNSTAAVNISDSYFVKNNYPYTIAGIDIRHYGNFSVTNNTFDGFYNGIQLGGSGESVVSNQLISGNEFKNCSMAGLLSYASRATIKNNHIHNNHYGINLGNNSSTDLSGNQSAQSWSETQQIVDNDSYELNIMDGCFPWNMHYNVIVDEDNLGNPTDPMVYYSEYNPGSLLKDVRFNCWGNNFNATDDLYPTGYFVNPIWCPGQLKSSPIADSAEALYLSAREQFVAGNYSTSKSSYKSVVSQYAVTKFAGAAMKDLFTLEEFESDNYDALKQYYETDTIIQSDTILKDLSVFLANKCDVKLENWQIAIDHYESIIENPENMEDSICAIIDLGDLYFLMENSASRVVIQGKLLEHKPTSKASYLSNWNYLLSLLPEKDKTNEEKEENGITAFSTLYQNMPNPFLGNTTIRFDLTEQGEVCIRVFDLAGKTVKETHFAKPAGTHKYYLEMGNLPNGAYFYSLSINGIQTDVKKMVFLK